MTQILRNGYKVYRGDDNTSEVITSTQSLGSVTALFVATFYQGNQQQTLTGYAIMVD